MSEITAVKMMVTGILAAALAYLGALAVPVILLTISMIIDYVTGLMAASHRKNTITSYRSINGIIKKVCLLLLVAVGLILDCLIFYIRDAFFISFSWSFVISAVIAVWITVNEILSILENIQDIGVTLPVWLLPLVKNLRGKLEGVAKVDEGEGK